jgi:hypothetical protein
MRDGKRLAGLVLAAGFTAASFDLLAACLISDKTPAQIMKVISIGWYGREHAKGLTETLVGGLSHYGILIVAAAVWALAGARLPVLVRRPVLTGLLYGAWIFVFMRFVVLPLSPVGFTKHWNAAHLIDFASHLLVGVTIALIVGLGLKDRLSASR